MSVSDGLLCSFELLKPLDSSALKSHIKKGRNKRNSMLNSPVSLQFAVFANRNGVEAYANYPCSLRLSLRRVSEQLFLMCLLPSWLGTYSTRMVL